MLDLAAQRCRSVFTGHVTEISAPPALDFETCLEQIWEQLIATPPTRGRSMTTVKIRNAHLVVLLGSHRIRQRNRRRRRRSAPRGSRPGYGFRRNRDGQGERSQIPLDKALSVGRVEVSRLQDRVDVAKPAKDTEAAVNLGISTKRLLSALDEAEKI